MFSQKIPKIIITMALTLMLSITTISIVANAQSITEVPLLQQLFAIFQIDSENDAATIDGILTARSICDGTRCMDEISAPWRPVENTNNFTLEEGNIGIGIADPEEKLEVDGSINATGIICDKNGCIGGETLWEIEGGASEGEVERVSVNTTSMNIGNTTESETLNVGGGIYASGNIASAGNLNIAGQIAGLVCEMSDCVNKSCTSSGGDDTQAYCPEKKIAYGVHDWSNEQVCCCTPVITCKIVHDMEKCTNAGGEPQDVNGNETEDEKEYAFCKITASTCPAGFYQYENWSTTEASSGVNKTNVDKFDDCPEETTGSHEWGNMAREWCKYTYYDEIWGHYLPREGTAYATITEIGCY